MQCNKHGRVFPQIVTDVKLLRLSEKCEECYSSIQSNRIRVTISELNNRIKNSKNSVIRDKQIVIRYEDHLHNDKNSMVLVKCNLFGHHKKPYPQTAISIGKNNICPECAKTREYKKKAGENLVEKINNILIEKNSSFSFFGSIDRNDKSIIFYELICKNCGCSEWEREKYVSSVKCKVCYPNDTIGESRVIKYLNFLKLTFKKQKKFPGMKNEKELKCDFFIPKLNLIIEFDGHQHYYPVDYFKGFNSFKKTIKCDWIKNRYALKNSINILRIPFYEYENIEKLIDDSIAKITNDQETCANDNNLLNVYKVNYVLIIVTKRIKFKKRFEANKKNKLTI